MWTPDDYAPAWAFTFGGTMSAVGRPAIVAAIHSAKAPVQAVRAFKLLRRRYKLEANYRLRYRQ
jgi:hypothetical protein